MGSIYLGMVRLVPLYNNKLKTFYLTNCHGRLVCGRRQLCSNTGQGEDSSLTFKEKMMRKHFFPNEKEAEVLHRVFPEPKKVVDDLFAPFQKVEENLVPKMEVRRQLGNSICKTKLIFQWPTSTDVSGIHQDEDTSVNNAYLHACNLLKNMGLVKVSDTETCSGVYTVDNVVKILEELASIQCNVKGYDSNNYRVINLLQHNQDEDLTWTSSIQVLWPICFTVNSKSTCLDLAYYQSCLKAVMKFKAFGYLDKYNNFQKGILLGLERYDSSHNLGFMTRDLLNPDYELFVDASALGMGAHLMSFDGERTRWLSDRWIPDKIKFEPRYSSELAEFYAFVTAMYTWKHKFVDKKVICYCDNLHVVNVINHGMYVSRRTSKKHEALKKLYVLLIKTCHKYNITVVGVHVPRLNNVAADLLSRCDVESFKKMMPTAYETPKKSKKLWFCSFNNDSDDENGKSTRKDNEDPESSS